MPEPQEDGLSSSPNPVLSEREKYEGPFVVIKVKDLLGITVGGGVHQFTYPPMVTLKEFISDVSERFQTPVPEIELIYQCGGGLLEICKMPGEWTLEGASMPADRERVYAVSIQKIKLKKKSLTKYNDIINSDGKDTGNSVNSSTNSSTNATLSGPCSCKSETMNLNGPREFVGLKNMTMTCYLNSVLQSLWFTPELKNSLYKFNGEKILQTQQKSVVHGLKRLFLLLQLSVRESVGTEELTKSFGWRVEESWTQHDIEEMFRVLSDALSKELKGTEMEGLFSALFGVLFADFISCQKCGNTREREDFQLGIALPIRNFGKPLNSPKLEEAIQAYVSTELLNENNRVNCDNCAERTDSVKGLKFKKLPYLLMFHLKRYEYDFEKQTRAKINDKIEFPSILNMNQFLLNKDGENVSSDKPAIVPLECGIPNLNPDWFVTPDHGKRRKDHSRMSVLIGDKTLKSSPEGENTPTEAPAQENGATKDTGYEIPADAKQHLEQSGPHVYQLYSVLTHRGNLTGGHYYAFIFDFESNIWYRCDDTKVMRVPEQDLRATYGGDAAVSRQGLYEVGTAYMLLYRKIDEKMNSLPLMFDHIPEFTQNMWHKMIEEDREAKKRDEVSRTVVLLQVKSPEIIGTESRSIDVTLPRNMSIKEAAENCLKQLYPNGEYNVENARIVKYDPDCKIIEYSWKDDSLSLDLAFPVSKCDESKPNVVLLELRSAPDVEWELFKASDTVCCAQQVNYKTQSIGKSTEIHITEFENVKILKQKVLSKFGLSGPNIQLFCVFGRHTLTHLNDDDRVIGHYHFGRVNDLFFEIVGDDEVEDLESFLNSYVGSICLDIHTPSAKPPVVTENGNVSLTNGTCDKSNGCEDIVANEAKEKKVKQKSGAKPTYFQVLSQNESSDQQWQIYSVRAERRLTLESLSIAVQDLIKVSEKHFIMYSVKDEKETELLEYDEKISHLQPISCIRIQYGSRMTENEARIAIYHLMPENKEKPMELLKELVFNKAQNVTDVKRIIAENCKSITGVVEPDRYRVRRKVGNNPGKILRDDMIFFDYCKRLGSESYVQIFDMPQNWSTSNFAFFTRLWSPDSFSVGDLIEVVVFHDYTKETEELIAEAVSSQYSIPVEFLGLSKVTYDYPYKVTAYACHETLSWFQIPRETPKLSLLSDDLVLCVKDTRVAAKTLSSEEMDEFRNEYVKETAEVEDANFIQYCCYTLVILF